MAAVARGRAMKAGGDKKQVDSRLLSVAVGCFVLFVVFTLSSRYNATFVLDTRKRASASAFYLSRCYILIFWASSCIISDSLNHRGLINTVN